MASEKRGWYWDFIKVSFVNISVAIFLNSIICKGNVHISSVFQILAKIVYVRLLRLSYNKNQSPCNIMLWGSHLVEKLFIVKLQINALINFRANQMRYT